MGNTSTVFIIDDDPIHQRIAQIMISKNQIYDDFVSYTEADKALEFLKANSEDHAKLPDVILLDLNMPVVDGWDFLESFEIFRQDLKKAVRVFIVTSSVDEKDIARSKLFASVKGFISKPLTPDIIRSTL
ncbi:Response regulator receiver domain-containing protein [Daejeonella rubra]|uniref:Response regulator receiver domain-containing protein n=1 Tax=Daejeonella rubra TaxID=990371 RepID=A0A1G9RJ56_9SPHI|nr:response regulator [Daejeonella rubra]SDM23359.1 Response regulator receiver domain-containing protein [Daejeonella rubra]